MRLLIQRVSFSNVKTEKIDSKINKGLLVYLGIKKGDEVNQIPKAISKLLKLRFFENEDGRLKLNIKDIDGSIMLISNFSLYAKADKGTTLSFDDSENSIRAKELYDIFLAELKKEYAKVENGQFQADMKIESLADGPVNVILDF